jgi:plasmid stabilization system protein ParE
VRVRYTRRAELSIERIDDWWRANRHASADLFWTELGQAVELLETSPEVGGVYKTRKGNQVRKIVLPKTEYHVYFQLDRDADWLMILVVWGARRERAPKL